MLLKLQSLQGVGQSPSWLFLFGELEGYSEEGRAQEKVKFRIPDQQAQGVALTAHLREPPLMNEAGRLSKSWIQSFLVLRSCRISRLRDLSAGKPDHSRAEEALG